MPSCDICPLFPKVNTHVSYINGRRVTRFEYCLNVLWICYSDQQKRDALGKYPTFCAAQSNAGCGLLRPFAMPYYQLHWMIRLCCDINMTDTLRDCVCSRQGYALANHFAEHAALIGRRLELSKHDPCQHFARDFPSGVILR